jgi:hypothetical protein
MKKKIFFVIFDKYNHTKHNGFYGGFILIKIQIIKDSLK